MSGFAKNIGIADILPKSNGRICPKCGGGTIIIKQTDEEQERKCAMCGHVFSKSRRLENR